MENKDKIRFRDLGTMLQIAVVSGLIVSAYISLIIISVIIGIIGVIIGTIVG